MATSQRENRLQRLIEGAKKEGELTYYQSRSDIGPVLDAFTKKYGITVKNWRSSGENVLQRVLTEARAGRFEVDVVETSAPQMEALHRENLLQQVKSPYHGDLMPQAIPAHKEWVGTTLDVYVQAYNTDKVRKEELPGTYQDLLDPRWKGRLGIEAADEHWFATLVEALGQEKGTKLFKDIVAANGISVRKGHSLLANLVASGEIPLGLTVYNYSPEQLKRKGSPIESFIIPPAIGQFVSIAALKKAPHPHAALLFYDFMLNEGQEILAQRYYIVTTDKIDNPLKKLPLKFIDPALSLDMNDKWIKAYEDIVTKRAKQ
ncbi:MAG: extracellular solute-binding protein [Burkholderiales bacterium]|nr:extracellular solute-binding protein [Burkholderiales bacterium]